MMAHRYQVQDLKLNCLDYGGEGKPPLLFLHGGSAHAHWWDFVAPAFTDSFHALALDQRGHGDSDWATDWAYGSRHYVSDLEQIIDHWEYGLPVLIGHSMGAHNALLYAASHSYCLRAIVIIDTLPEYTDTAVQFLRTYAEKPPRQFPSLEEAVANFRVMPRETFAAKAILDHMARHTYRQGADGMWTHKLDRRTLIREPLNIWDCLPQIVCPALVVKLSESPLMSREIALDIAHRLPNGRFAEISHSCHHVMFDNPKALIALLRNFLERLPDEG